MLVFRDKAEKCIIIIIITIFLLLIIILYCALYVIEYFQVECYLSKQPTAALVNLFSLFFPWRETAVGVCGPIRQVRKSLSRKCEKIRGLFTRTLAAHQIFFFALEKASSVWPMTSGADASGPSAEMHHTWGRQEAAAECHCRVSAVVCETGFRVYLRPVLIKLNSPNVWRNTMFTESPFKKNWAAFK